MRDYLEKLLTHRVIVGIQELADVDAKALREHANVGDLLPVFRHEKLPPNYLVDFCARQRVVESEAAAVVLEDPQGHGRVVQQEPQIGGAQRREQPPTKYVAQILLLSRRTRHGSPALVSS